MKTPDPTYAESSAPNTRQFSRKSTATEAQIERLIELLRRAPRNTHELRRHGISHPAGRVQNLTQRGYMIASDRVTTVDGDGFHHVNVALYSLIAEPGDALPSTVTTNHASASAGRAL